MNEIDVFRIFEHLGYRKLLSFELSRLCTTTHLPKYLKRLLHIRKAFRKEHMPYKVTAIAGVLPQGAPTSPMLSNLAAEKLDNQQFPF